MKNKVSKFAAVIISAVLTSVLFGGMSASASYYDPYTYFDEIAAKVYFSAPGITRSEALSSNYGVASGSISQFMRYRVSVYPKYNVSQTLYLFDQITLSCSFDRTDHLTTNFSKTQTNSTYMPAKTSSDVYASYAMTSGTHTLTVTYLGYSGGLTMYTS